MCIYQLPYVPEMNIQTLLTSLQLREDKDWEFKSARGGLPAALWETYSAMANTDGGVIVLGVKERDDGQFEVQGIDDPTKTADITKMLQDLVAKGFLIKEGYGRWASYQLSERCSKASKATDTDLEYSPHKEPSSPHKDSDSQHTDPVLGDLKLLAIALPAREKARLSPAQMRSIIRQLCAGRFLTYQQIGRLLNRNPEGIRDRFLGEMVKENELQPRHPDPTHPDQAYTAIRDETNHDV